MIKSVTFTTTSSTHRRLAARIKASFTRAFFCSRQKSHTVQKNLVEIGVLERGTWRWCITVLSAWESLIIVSVRALLRCLLKIHQFHPKLVSTIKSLTIKILPNCFIKNNCFYILLGCVNINSCRNTNRTETNPHPPSSLPVWVWLTSTDKIGEKKDKEKNLNI